MFARLLGLKDALSINYFHWYLRQGWSPVVVILLVLLAIAYAVWLYRREVGLTRPRRLTLGIFRAMILGAIVLMLFEPAFGVEATVKLRRALLVLVDRSDSMRKVDNREKRPDLEDAAIGLGKIKPDAKGALLDPYRKDISAASRLDLAKGLASNPEIFSALGQDNDIHYFTFNSALDAIPGDNADALRSSLAKAQADNDRATALGSAIHDAVARYAGQPIAGVVVLSDGGSNTGLDLDSVATDMKRRRVPVYTVGIGIPDPPDVAVQDIDCPGTVFANDKLTVRARVDSTGFNRQQAVLSLALDGVEIAHKAITLTGSTQYEDFTFTPDKRNDSAKLSATIATLPGESNVDNNSVTKPIRITDEKIKVLYVEGKPRWEFRYLRTVLRRDPRLDVKFLMTQGDPDLARYSPEYIDRFPEDASAFNFDMIIIGDVPFTYFTPEQTERIRRLVVDQGGSLLMLAGRRYNPVSYAGTPLGKLLPVEPLREAPISLGGEAHPVITPKGLSSTSTMLDQNAEYNAQLWSLVRPLYQLPALKSIKGGASVLAELNEPILNFVGKDRYPLICWHRDGEGKVMFVATDQLWRMRFKQGDRYHARFWGQTIQFMSLSRLLGGNKRITLRIDHKEFQPPAQVLVSANVLNQAYEPAIASEYIVSVERKGSNEAVPLRLEPVKEQPGRFQGYFAAEKDGDYTVRTNTEDALSANTVDFHVKTEEPEKRFPNMQESALRQVAELSGGKYFVIRDIGQLPQLLGAEHPTTTVKLEKDLWDLPAVFLLLICFAGVEWFVRRRSNLI
jgi:hypothetical protein